MTRLYNHIWKYPAAVDDAQVAQSVGVNLAVIIAQERDCVTSVAVGVAVPGCRALALVGELLLCLAVEHLEEVELYAVHVLKLSRTNMSTT